MVCQQYRICIMALLDGEVTEIEREEIEEHLNICPSCHHEYEAFLQIHDLTGTASAAILPPDFTWDNYYHGVCRKMEHKASWAAWSVVSLLLVLAGTLMIFGFRDTPLAIVAGSIAFIAGAGLIFVSYYCNCSK